MPCEQIYIFEVIVRRLVLEPNFKVDNINDFTLTFKFGHIVNFDLNPCSFTTPEAEDNLKYNINSGKTFLFMCKPSVLKWLLESEPLVVTLNQGINLVGSYNFRWSKEFLDMVKLFELLGIVKSSGVDEHIPFMSEYDRLVARADMFIKMACFGNNVQTVFQIRKSGNKEEYIFRERNEARTFKCERFPDQRSDPLVWPLYTGAADSTNVGSQINVKENASLTAVFESNTPLTSKLSHYQKADDASAKVAAENNSQYDLVSICFRPSENKFFDILNMMSDDVITRENSTCFTIPKNKLDQAQTLLQQQFQPKRKDPRKREVRIQEEEAEEEPAYVMTADKIARNLCGNKDCPAVKKFGEYGIGPLATGPGLGTLYGLVEPPVTYGLSHTYGTMSNYGPFGLFSKPKNDEMPFESPVGADNSSGEKLPAALPPKKLCKHCKQKKKAKIKGKVCPGEQCPLRLRGGGEDQPEDDEDTEFVEPKSPILECKSVMDQFDDILAAYKKALGPCGQAICPYAQTLAEASCKKSCDQPQLPAEEDEVSCTNLPCEMPECPYTEPKKKRYPAGCGSPKCAYTKYKLGLVDNDAELELQFLPPALKVGCGDPKCKYPFEPDLPPIHWDCPDPLPKTKCKNPNCPFLPPPLRKFKTKELKRGPCGSPFCPYALPQPCGMPTCPFAQQPCPMAENNSNKKRAGAPESDESMCDPKCQSAGKRKSKEEDPNLKGEFEDCAEPECPFKTEAPEDKDNDTCCNPDCPYNKKKSKKKKKRVCENPDCPFAEKADKQKSNGRSKKTSDDNSICSNPGCPFSKDKAKNSSSNSSAGGCSDPECPYQQTKGQKKTNGSDSGSCHMSSGGSVCSNPECPYKPKDVSDNVCDDPQCPYSNDDKKPICEDPYCPYAQPLPSCGIPNCPYEPIPLGFCCKNPKCPSKKVDFKRKIDHTAFNPVGGETSPKNGNGGDVIPVLVTTTVCEENVVCEDVPEGACENPDCPAGGQLVIESNGKKKKAKVKGKRKKKGKYVYSIGDTYPGTKLGHKECVTPVFNVPHNMGWLWNIWTPILSMKPRRGWRPGALGRSIAERIKAHRQAKGLGFLKLPHFGKQGILEAEEKEVVPRPTLQIQKKEGCYWITMNPLKDPYSLTEREDPYMECTPMTFKITKKEKKDEYCYCDGGEEEQESVASSDSELDIEFTPPAGIIHPERFKKKPNVVCADSQYDPQDFEVPKKKGDAGGEKGGKGKDKGGKGKKGKK